MSVRSEYGFTQQEYDHNLFYNKRSFEIIWSGYGTPDNSPDVNLYLERDGNKGIQGLYIPENTFCLVTFEALVYDAGGNTTVQLETGSFTRASGGNATYTGGAIGTINPTVTPTANTTVQALEIVVSDADSEQVTYVVVRGRFLVIHTLATGQSKLTAAPTSALTAAE